MKRLEDFKKLKGAEEELPEVAGNQPSIPATTRTTDEGGPGGRSAGAAAGGVGMRGIAVGVTAETGDGLAGRSDTKVRAAWIRLPFSNGDVSQTPFRDATRNRKCARQARYGQGSGQCALIHRSSHLLLVSPLPC